MVQEKTVNEIVTVQPAETTHWYQVVSYKDSKIFIKTNLTTAARSFIAVGYYLKHIRDTAGYAEDGYADIWEFAQAEYGISKSTASRYMTMNNRFSWEGNSPLIRAEYKGFGKSQLQEMLSLTDEQLDQVRPTDRVEDIRNMRKPREIPYIEIPGQVELTDFPEVDPADVQAAAEAREKLTASSQEREVYTVSAADLLGEDTAGRAQPVAISQQQAADQEQAAPVDKPQEDGDKPDVIENPPPRPELPILKNNDQRAAFVDAYDTWPMWIETVQTGERYYRYDLEDGTSIVVKVYHAMLFDYTANGLKYEERFTEGYGRHEYYLLQPGKFFRDCEANRSALIEKLKGIQRKGRSEKCS